MNDSEKAQLEDFYKNSTILSDATKQFLIEDLHKNDSADESSDE